MYNCFRFKKLSKNNDRFKFQWRDCKPYLFDRTEKTNFDRHYVLHPAWAARVVKKINPSVHYDISSTLNFCTIISAFIPVKFFDYRPADLNLESLTSKHVDLVKMPFTDNSIFSLSCMHTVEHIGLGRYGDPIDSKGDLKAISELKRVLAVNGNLLFVVPIGKPRIVYNAHRIYSYNQILTYFSDLDLEEFTLITDNKDDGLVYNASKEMADKQSYGCGCFWFKK
ncbi:MAG: DUF268 domain-containing protein [Patescibacteria group bacterium]